MLKNEAPIYRSEPSVFENKGYVIPSELTSPKRKLQSPRRALAILNVLNYAVPCIPDDRERVGNMYYPNKVN